MRACSWSRRFYRRRWSNGSAVTDLPPKWNAAKGPIGWFTFGVRLLNGKHDQSAGRAQTCRSDQSAAELSAFHRSPPADLEPIAAATGLKSCEQREYPFHEGDPAIGFCVVQPGAVNVPRVRAVGKAQVIHVFRMGDSFAGVAQGKFREPNGSWSKPRPSQLALAKLGALLRRKLGELQGLRRRYQYRGYELRTPGRLWYRLTIYRWVKQLADGTVRPGLNLERLPP